VSRIRVKVLQTGLDLQSIRDRNNVVIPRYSERSLADGATDGRFLASSE
jgi:hypothetical protein